MTGPPNNNQSGNHTNGPKFTSRHPKFYIEGADLYIIADKTLFRVHSYFFVRESTAFHRKIYPASPGNTAIGTDKDPVLLDNVTPEELETFISVFYNPRYSIYDKPIEQWQIILRLATEWEFNEVKELAVRELHKKPELPLVERLALYEQYRVDPRHLIPLYATLCAQDTPLTLAESKILGLETTVNISRMREKLRALPSNEGRSPLPPDLEMQDVFRALEIEINITPGSTLALQQELGLSSPITVPHMNANFGHNSGKPGGKQSTGTGTGKGGKASRNGQ